MPYAAPGSAAVKSKRNATSLNDLDDAYSEYTGEDAAGNESDKEEEDDDDDMQTDAMIKVIIVNMKKKKNTNTAAKNVLTDNLILCQTEWFRQILFLI